MSSGATGPGLMMECPICMDAYDTSDRTPKVLPCGHSVCEHCIVGCIQRSKAKCPSCRKVSSVPAEGFPTNYALTDGLANARRCAGRRCTNCQEETPYEKLYVCPSCDRAPAHASGICSSCVLSGHRSHVDAILDLKDLAKPQAVQRARSENDHSKDDFRAHIESALGILRDLHEGFEDASDVSEGRYGEMLATLDAAAYVTTETLQKAIDDARELNDELGAVVVDVSETLKECESTLRRAVRNYAVERRTDQEDDGQEEHEEEEEDQDDDGQEDHEEEEEDQEDDGHEGNEEEEEDQDDNGQEDHEEEVEDAPSASKKRRMK